MSPHAGQDSSKQSLWHRKAWTLENLYCEVLLYYNCVFVRGAHQQRLMQRLNFTYLFCIGNTSAPLHLSLRSWLLKVDSKHGLCWLSACLYIRTQIVGKLTACCCQSNKSCPLWPHLPVKRCWTLNNYVIYLICVSSAFPPSSLPSVASLRPYTWCVFFPYQKEILFRNRLCPFVTYYALAFVMFHCELSLA